MTSEIITTQSELESLLNSVSSSAWIAIDTEFIRESSYYPKLCLVQIATADICTCVDVLALKQSHSLIDIFTNPAQVKIFHSARQDLEVLYADYDVIPNPVFDTQIAASMLGPDGQISYAELVEQELCVRLDKSESRTDWTRRPLSDAQIDYALNDVLYLGPLYQQLSNSLADKNRSHWLEEECIQLIEPGNYRIDPIDAWKNVKGVGKAQGPTLSHIQQLSNWRENTAQMSNRPRQWILKDRAILDLAYMTTHTDDAIVSYLESEWPKSVRHKDTIVELLLNSSPTDHTGASVNMAEHRLNKSQQAQVKTMMNHIRERAQEIGTSPSLLANRKSIENLVLGKNSKVTSGWRQSTIGDELKQILASEST